MISRLYWVGITTLKLVLVISVEVEAVKASLDLLWTTGSDSLAK